MPATGVRSGCRKPRSAERPRRLAGWVGGANMQDVDQVPSPAAQEPPPERGRQRSTLDSSWQILHFLLFFYGHVQNQINFFPRLLISFGFALMNGYHPSQESEIILDLSSQPLPAAPNASIHLYLSPSSLPRRHCAWDRSSARLPSLLLTAHLSALSLHPEPDIMIFPNCESCLVTPRWLRIACTVKPELLSIEMGALRDPGLGSPISLISLAIKVLTVVEPMEWDLWTGVLERIRIIS